MGAGVLAKADSSTSIGTPLQQEESQLPIHSEVYRGNVASCLEAAATVFKPLVVYDGLSFLLSREADDPGANSDCWIGFSFEP